MRKLLSRIIFWTFCFLSGWHIGKCLMGELLNIIPAVIFIILAILWLSELNLNPKKEEIKFDFENEQVK